MSLAETHRDEFIKLIEARDEDKCIEYINKYNDFYNAIYYKHSIWDITRRLNILMYVCECKLSRVAIALIDKKCDLTCQDYCGYTALMYANMFGLYDVVGHIINNSSDISTRYTDVSQISEMMYLCRDHINDTNIMKMIDMGYDIYYKNYNNESLLTEAIFYNSTDIVKKLIDKDVDFIEEFKTYYGSYRVETSFNDTIIEHIYDRYNIYKDTIIAIMNDTSPTNMLYLSFHTTYAVQLVDIICDFLISPIKKS
ncbi:MAG: hypothetical protein Faunusvirus13_13 [Faunusvirus sp.]|jgi:ankyrin repeat protein|uniref:Uncharacterized protein n=1 Tax=Faunusvirus sp. TaxID=2487766 RepID=A0A3G4ZX46_9VIRU|nr:MAG: hypothetical protein Faunusvirus13_13 [Faunusvirus sp.]